MLRGPVGPHLAPSGLAVLMSVFAVLMGNSALSEPSPSHLATQTSDPNLWLEDIEGPRALAWVEKQNARSLAVLEGDRRFDTFHAQALAIVNATDRIPAPELIGQTVYNFWQDPANIRGLWRRVAPADFAAASPAWETVLNLDALSAAEKANWVWKGDDCPPPDYRRCLIFLSDGGEDATEVREFDPAARAFVQGGFRLPRGKQSTAWLDDDTLLVARDWGPGTMTASGYPFVVKTLKRGQPLGEAREVFRGTASDVSVDPLVLHDGQGNQVALIVRATDFFHSEVHLLTARGEARLDLPEKARLHGLLGGRLVFSSEQDWTRGGRTFKAGALLAFPVDALAKPPSPAGKTKGEPLIFQPGPRQSVETVAVTRDRIVAEIYDNVRGGLAAFFPAGAGGWRRADFPVASSASVNLATADVTHDDVYYSVEGFLDPTRLFQGDAETAAATPIKALPARFDASGDTVEQFEAVSKDGTKVPYFVVHPKGMALDGSNPTLLYAYGGFQASMLPSYSAAVGKLWLEHGGVYVLANIRGGGEFGPAWHEAGLKTHRQLIYDDFAAVAQDLIARKITSPRRLGIEGGSNGGLLMGVEFNQHPELWRAVVIQVPLLDMMRYESIGAGASWAGEYGSVAVPAERAFLASISPYDNLRAGVSYPEPFFVTSTKDDRVTPVHARKMSARMEAMGLPFLYFENTNGGHAASANLAERAERVALEFTYLTRKLVD